VFATACIAALIYKAYASGGRVQTGAQKSFKNKTLSINRSFVASGHIFPSLKFFNHKNSLLIVSSDYSPKRQIDVAKCFRKVAKS
jgi:hypothetical protein